MPPRLLKWIELPRALAERTRRAPLILVNGLAEQQQSWFANERYLSRRFEVLRPEILAYDGDDLHAWVESGRDVTVDYLAGRLGEHLARSGLAPPYNLAASSLGCQVVLTFAAAHPGTVDRMVLLCPSGFHGEENMPMLDGVRRSRYDSLVGSVFHQSRYADQRLISAFERKFQDRRWKKGVLKTLRGTVGHSVAHLLPGVEHQTLVIWGADDQILSDVPGSIRAAATIPGVRQVVIPDCGHAPQIEKAGLVNRLIDRFLNRRLGALTRRLDAQRFLDVAEGRGPTAHPLGRPSLISSGS